MLTFKHQFDKLTRAYIAGEINPWDGCSCFVGTLLNGDSTWTAGRCVNAGMVKGKGHPDVTIGTSEKQIIRGVVAHISGLKYTPEEIYDLEAIFLYTLVNEGGNRFAWRRGEDQPSAKDEEALFKAFETTLDALRKLHESKGEIVDDFEFKKRENVQPVSGRLQTA